MTANSRVIINNGFGQFHLARLAENLNRDHELELFLTGAYPPRVLSGVLARSRNPALRRLMGRKIAVTDATVRSFWLGEVPHQFSQYARHRGWSRASETATALTLDAYRAWAKSTIDETIADVYHYRAGMGGSSVETAKANGAVAVCDHSIVHPRLLPGMIDGSGRFESTLSQLWRRVEEDISCADHVLVNSDFVAETCAAVGIPVDKISVAYTGVDPQFMATLDRYECPTRWQRPQALFAGTLERRKGVDVAVRVAKETASPALPWLFMGNWEQDSRHLASELGGFISHKTRADRSALAKTLAESAIFVFPTRAEGSARVVAEAMVAGCYVIATRNAGSVLRNGVDGRLVEVEDPAALKSAIEEYLDMGVDERQTRSEETKRYARQRLSESTYSASVASAYTMAKRSSDS